eukprot:CAMPEP_0174736640 /NCGR_PEP_ID=MMETSP1094-20130205/67016_1 /TAXON_ID=156173 /ORGANISM="Chrysochromulina brevifilum, Strain UTEX LB 985" /LENGTH=85 /DNA_ID=CAMNT_0015939773 /DNA_START=455 /DNA_END=713 /DNA_ORIENTATION=+
MCAKLGIQLHRCSDLCYAALHGTGERPHLEGVKKLYALMAAAECGYGRGAFKAPRSSGAFSVCSRVAPARRGHTCAEAAHGWDGL